MINECVYSHIKQVVLKIYVIMMDISARLIVNLECITINLPKQYVRNHTYGCFVNDLPREQFYNQYNIC